MEAMGEAVRAKCEKCFPNFSRSGGKYQNHTLYVSLWISSIFPMKRKKNPKNQRKAGARGRNLVAIENAKMGELREIISSNSAVRHDPTCLISEKESGHRAPYY
jgi:hypothetical protein